MKKSKIKNKINLNVKPRTGLNNKTGAWRTYRPLIDYAACISCSLCSKICPEGCILMKEVSMMNKKKPAIDPGKNKTKKLRPIIDYNYCKGCGLCARECPVKAIKMESDY